MTTKEKVVRESIRRLEKELAKVMELWNATPLQDIIELRKEFSEKFGGNVDHNDPALKEWLEKAVKKEKQLFALAEKQQKETLNLPKRRATIENELGNLRSELYFIERRYNQEV